MIRAAFLVLSLWLLGCGTLLAGDGVAPSSQPLDKITLQLKWRHQFQFAGYYAADAMGYYRDAGLDVQIVEARPGEEPMLEVVEGRAEFGVGTTDLLLMRDKGVPGVVLADFFQHSPVALMVRKDSGIRNIHELAKGRLMIEPHSAELIAYLTDEGISPDALELVEHDFDTASLIDGTVDAMSVYISDEPFALKVRGVDYLIFQPIEAGIDFYGDNLFTIREQVERNPERVRRFLDASVRGWQYAMANPDEIAALITQRYGDRKSLEWLMFEAEQMQPLINADIIAAGYVNAGRWDRIAERYAGFAMINPDIDLDGFIYDPDGRPDYGFLYRLIGIPIAVAAILAALVFWFVWMNRRLRFEVAERAEAQAELESLNGQKSLLLSIVGHDLRSAFNVLLNYGELLVDGGDRMDKPRLAGIHRNLRDAAQGAYALLNNLLDWAALQAGQREAAVETLAAAPLVAQAAAQVVPQAEAKDVEIRMDLAEDAMVHADSRMTETILRNLIGNAVKFTKAGGTVSIGLRQDAGRIEVMVADTGVGIAPDRLDHLFDRETKHPTIGTEGEQGSGLGLVLCRDFAAAHGGELRIDSELGTGTTAFLYLPAAAEA
ncbi:MAG: ABC transporter substrate-binding protein [Proteobacteria bacterium]|nr:ABC transporter substrate-binding protein [Pseudomonadota bacterium]